MNIINIFSRQLKMGAALVGTPVLEGLNRADELGGELRDYLLERSELPVLRKFGERLARLGGINLEEESVESVYQQQVAAAAAVAPPPTAAQVASSERSEIGDPEVAAQIYGRESCPWTGRARTLLNDAKIDFDFVELDDSENAHLEGKLVSQTTQSTVPYVFLRGEFVGGFNELSEVVRLGQLEYRTLSAEDRAASDARRPHLVVDIAPRRESAA